MTWILVNKSINALLNTDVAQVVVGQGLADTWLDNAYVNL
jgi:hypothetical protein